jgi:hypothetical protein
MKENNSLVLHTIKQTIQAPELHFRYNESLLSNFCFRISLMLFPAIAIHQTFESFLTFKYTLMKTIRNEETTKQKKGVRNMKQEKSTKQNNFSIKKIMMTLMLASSVMTNVFASEDKVSPEILQAFNSKFQKAQSITWTAADNYYKASFNYSGSWMYAWYTKDGKFVSVTRNVKSYELPFYLRNSLKNKYAGFWITNVIEESNKYGFSYYIKLENADKKIVLKSKSGGDWVLNQETDK